MQKFLNDLDSLDPDGVLIQTEDAGSVFTTNASMRFYPESLPPFEGEATKEFFSIVLLSKSKGEGVISLRDIRKGETVARFSGFLLDKVTLYTLQISKDLHLHDPYFMGKVIHSCDPNMRCDMTVREFIAIKNISAGEVLTMDYETVEDRLFRPFLCSCGFDNCRGVIRGKDFL